MGSLIARERESTLAKSVSCKTVRARNAFLGSEGEEIQKF
jgi:hypothetical protein